MTTDVANKITEVIFLGLPGPTHNYGGLSADNMASSKNRGAASHPREAALQVLSLARLLFSFGARVAILPPQLRPHLQELRKFFSGDEEMMIAGAMAHKPALLEAVSSSSNMWVANAATVTYGTDKKLHLTTANLHTNLHRRIEANDTYFTLRDVFSRVPRCLVYMPLLADEGLRDEGAANHMRLAKNHELPALNVFVYGTDESMHDPETARQTMSASDAIANKHGLTDDEAVMVKQSATAIRSGVFHNDVIAVSNENFLLVHEDAYALGTADIEYIKRSYEELTKDTLIVRVVTNAELSLIEAVQTYFFNSQIVSLPEGGMLLVAPLEAEELALGKAKKLIDAMIADANNPITKVAYVDVRQSMKNGGGPACLRLRVPMDAEQLAALEMHTRVVMSESRLQSLEDVVKRTYPETLHAADINYELYQQSKEALHALGVALGLDLVRS